MRKVIYENDSMLVTLEDEGISISVYNIKRLEMAESEFEEMIAEYLLIKEPR